MIWRLHRQCGRALLSTGSPSALKAHDADLRTSAEDAESITGRSLDAAEVAVLELELSVVSIVEGQVPS